MITLKIIIAFLVLIAILIFISMAITTKRDADHESCKPAKPPPDPVEIDDLGHLSDIAPANIGATTEPPATGTASTIHTVCAWCPEELRAPLLARGGAVSHILCPACARTYFPSHISTDRPLRTFKLGGASHG